MATEIRVPTLGESVTEATIARWFKKAGEPIAVDEPVVELETDKVTVEVPAPAAGVLESIIVPEGETVEVGAVLGRIGAAGAAAAPTGRPDQKTDATTPINAGPEQVQPRTPPAEKPATDMPPAPAAAKLMAEKGLDAAAVQGSGKRGQILKEDVLAAERGGAAPSRAAAPAGDIVEFRPTAAPSPSAPAQVRAPSPPDDAAREERVRMTKLRQTIARRLKEAQATAAMLTTFNDVDMSAVMALRNKYKDLFEKKHGVRLGFMGFFVQAVVHALKEIPAVNAEIDGQDIVYKNYYHIGVAVGTDKGLVVPVLRDADGMSLADIEKKIGEFGRKARDGQLTIEDMQGGTFTISNGGVYGSLISTPILNAPQSGILGMHRVEERPVVRGGQIVARPMMYLALSYDHRLIDGKDAVTFLVRVKESIEDPQRLVLDL